MLRTMSCVRIFPLESPTNTSAPLIASVRVFLSVLSLAKKDLYWSRSVASLMEHAFAIEHQDVLLFDTHCDVHFGAGIGRGPCTVDHHLYARHFLPESSTAFSNPAALIIAVPCWSSCIKGISSTSLRRRSISKHSGALMSSRLMPPNVGAIFLLCLQTHQYRLFRSQCQTHRCLRRS